MNANEAPEKIYIQSFTSNEENAIYFDAIWTEEPETGEENIEYTRTDAFIEKACEFLKSYRQYTSDGTGYIPGIVNDKTIEDFKNYMKGE